MVWWSAGAHVLVVQGIMMMGGMVVRGNTCFGGPKYKIKKKKKPYIVFRML